MKTNYKYYIGIDCGVNTGICVWIKGDKAIRHIATVRIHQAMEGVKFWHTTNPGAVLVRVEDARKRTWVPRYESESRERGRREGAGSVKRDAIIWEDFLSDLGVDFEMVAPKNNKTKLTAADFKRITHYSGSTSEHARDAAMLVIGF
jgi:hypothetical protein